MKCEEILLNEIERYRNLMVQQSLEFSYSSNQVVEISSKLDKLLNKYDKYRKKEFTS